jgi:predicted nucleic acid-binding protein
MLAIDTNVVVRFLTRDDPGQAARARALIEREDILLASTVLLETEWVLRSAYGLGRTEVIGALTRFAGLPRVTLDEPIRVAKALAWAEDGMDLADALHLAAADGCEAFMTFDRRMAKAAVGFSSPEIRAP